MQVATLFPATSAADGVCSNFANGTTTAYVIHVAEGVDATALAEFAKLGTITTTDDCLYDARRRSSTVRRSAIPSSPRWP